MDIFTYRCFYRFWIMGNISFYCVLMKKMKKKFSDVTILYYLIFLSFYLLFFLKTVSKQAHGKCRNPKRSTLTRTLSSLRTQALQEDLAHGRVSKFSKQWMVSKKFRTIKKTSLCSSRFRRFFLELWSSSCL